MTFQFDPRSTPILSLSAFYPGVSSEERSRLQGLAAEQLMREYETALAYQLLYRERYDEVLLDAARSDCELAVKYNNDALDAAPLFN